MRDDQSGIMPDLIQNAKGQRQAGILFSGQLLSQEALNLLGILALGTAAFCGDSVGVFFLRAHWGRALQ